MVDDRVLNEAMEKVMGGRGFLTKEGSTNTKTRKEHLEKETKLQMVERV